MALTKENITRELLEKAATDLNKTILDKESMILIDGVMESALEADVLEVGKMLIETDITELKAKTKEVLGAMEVKLFVEKEIAPSEEIKEVKEEEVKTEEIVEESETSDEPEKKEAVEIPVKVKKQEQKENKKTSDNKEKKKKYTRAQAFCDALTGKQKTLVEIAEKAMKLHNDANPNKKQPQLASIEWAVRDYIQPLVILGFVTLKDKKYFLK